MEYRDYSRRRDIYRELVFPHTELLDVFWETWQKVGAVFMHSFGFLGILVARIDDRSLELADSYRSLLLNRTASTWAVTHMGVQQISCSAHYLLQRFSIFGLLVRAPFCCSVSPPRLASDWVWGTWCQSLSLRRNGNDQSWTHHLLQADTILRLRARDNIR